MKVNLPLGAQLGGIQNISFITASHLLLAFRLLKYLNLPFVYLDLKKVCEAVGNQKTWVYQQIEQGNFPEGDLLSPRCRRWKSTEIAAWLEAQATKASELRAEYKAKASAKATKAINKRWGAHNKAA